MLPRLGPSSPKFSRPLHRPGPGARARIRAGTLGGALAMIVLIAPAARAEAGAQQPALPAPASPPISFSADSVEFDDSAEIGTAKGNVLLRRDERTVRADTVTWNHKTGQIVAQGHVRLVDQDGNQLFTDRAELTDSFDIGTMDNMLISLREGGRLAANSGSRGADGTVRLSRVAYSGCDVVDAEGCDKHPTWQIVARRATYDPARKLVKFEGARLMLLGAKLLPLPPLLIATDGRAISGLLIPDFRLSTSNGIEMSQTWYQRLADNRDIAVTGYVFSQVAPMVSFDYRALGNAGAYDVTAYVTRSALIPLGATTGNQQTEFRGYLSTNGRFQPSPGWSVDFSGRVVTDQTFLRRYDLSADDTLRSTASAQHTAANSYFSLTGWAFQTLRTTERQGLVPIALPELDYRLRLPGQVLGGRVEIQVNSLAITRSAGQNTQRAFASARWDLRRVTGLGQQVTFTTLLRGDAYHSSGNSLTTTATYRGLPGWQARGVALAALDMTWPFIGAAFGGTQVLTPHLQVVATPGTRNLAVPNEDARAIELEDTNLFALNRFPGYDRVEDGTRFTYGLDWQLDRPGWRVTATLGQSYRLTERPTLLPPGTGLDSRLSDIVGRVELRYGDFFKLTSRFRLDRDTLAARRNELDATLGSERTYFEIGYARLNRNIAAALEDLQDSNELRAAARVSFARHWSVFGSGVFDLSGQTLTGITTPPAAVQPLRTRLGFAFQNNCLDLALTWRRDYITVGDAARGNSFMLHLALRNLGVK